MSISSGCLDGENSAFNFEQGDIKGTTTEIENQHMALFAFLSRIKSIGNSGSRGFVDDS